LNVIRQNGADFEHEKLVHPQTHSHTHKKFITTPKNIDQVPSALFGVFNIHNRQQQLKAATFFKVARSVTQAHTHAIFDQGLRRLMGGREERASTKWIHEKLRGI
jgi:hypothetical protein